MEATVPSNVAARTWYWSVLLKREYGWKRHAFSPERAIPSSTSAPITSTSTTLIEKTRNTNGSKCATCNRQTSWCRDRSSQWRHSECLFQIRGCIPRVLFWQCSIEKQRSTPDGVLHRPYMQKIPHDFLQPSDGSVDFIDKRASHEPLDNGRGRQSVEVVYTHSIILIDTACENSMNGHACFGFEMLHGSWNQILTILFPACFFCSPVPPF